VRGKPIMNLHRISGMGMRVCALGLLLQFVPLYAAECAENDSVVVGQGKFLLHRFEQVIGEETFRIVRG
jgi:hypothetical protein